MRFFTFISILTIIQASSAQSYTELCESGKKHFEQKEYKLAAEYFNRAANAATDKKEKIYTLTNLGYSQRMCVKKESAAESYAKALALDSTNIALLTQRGNILLELDSAKAAIDCYNRILTRQPDNNDIVRFRAYAYTQAGEYKNGKQDYIKLISLNNNDTEARLGLALLYEKEGNINESLMMLETLIEEYPNNPEYYIARSSLERTQKQNELALQDVDKAIELAPGNINYHILRAELLKDLGQHDAARRCRRKISKMMATPQR